MIAQNAVTIVLKLPEETKKRLDAFSVYPGDTKFLIMSAVDDYIKKREGRIRRAEREREEK